MRASAFAVVGRGEEAIDEAVVGIGARVVEEGGEFGGGGGKAGEVEGEAADEGWFVGFGGGGGGFPFRGGQGRNCRLGCGPKMDLLLRDLSRTEREA